MRRSLILTLLLALSLPVATMAQSGLRTRGGAEGVGLSTTRAVVVAIFTVIIADCVFSLAMYL